jgi:hypothetical protein
MDLFIIDRKALEKGFLDIFTLTKKSLKMQIVEQYLLQEPK